MLKTYMALSLTLLLSMSPALSAFLSLICCCDDDVAGLYFLSEEYSHSVQNPADDHAHHQASHHSEDADNVRDAHDSHDSEPGQAFGADWVVTAVSVGSLPASCTCSEADDPGKAVSQTGITNRPISKLASFHLDSAVEVDVVRRFPRNLTTDGRDLSPPGPHVFLVNRSLLI